MKLFPRFYVLKVWYLTAKSAHSGRLPGMSCRMDRSECGNVIAEKKWRLT